ncbi:hypothetical protein ACHAWF_004940 [Thalassiosira exigua]
MCFPIAATNHRLPTAMAMAPLPFQRRAGAKCKRADMESIGCNGGLRPKRLKITKRAAKKTVKFSPHVNLRCFYDPCRDDPLHKALVAPHLWADADELNRTKRRAKELSLRHRRCAAASSSSKEDLVPGGCPKRALAVAVAEATRYEHRGESLRGMENVTSAVVGRKRKLVKERATAAVMMEQQDQLIERTLSSSSAEEARNSALVMDAGKLARAYGGQTRKSLAYARLVAREDAKVSAEILAEPEGGGSGKGPSYVQLFVGRGLTRGRCRGTV